jgi:hypothetical protein
MRFPQLCWLAVNVIGMLQADTLTYTVTPNGSEFDYNFTLTNTGTTGGSLFDLFLSMPTDIANIDTANIGTPTGWGDATGGLLFFGSDASPSTSFIQWSADFSGTYDVAIGTSRSGFLFSADELIGIPIRYALNGSIELATAQDVSQVVPEPESFGLMLLAVGVSGIQRRWHEN